MVNLLLRGVSLVSRTFLLVCLCLVGSSRSSSSKSTSSTSNRDDSRGGGSSVTSSSSVGAIDGLAQAEFLVETGVDDFDILSEAMKPEMVKRLTETEAATLRGLESDIVEAKADLKELGDETADIYALLRDFEYYFGNLAREGEGGGDGRIHSEEANAIVGKLQAKIENLRAKVGETTKHLSDTNQHFVAHEEELHRLHTEVFAAEIAADIMNLMNEAEGIDYNSGDVRLNVGGLGDGESLTVLKKKLLRSLQREKEKATELSQRLIDPAVMQLDFDLLLDICTLIVASAVGGTLAAIAHVPTIIGQILGGLLVGPSGFHVVKDITAVHTVAQLGSVCILFRKGVYFPLELAEQSNPRGLETGAMIMGLVALTLSMLAGATGYASSVSEALMFGVTMCISSTGMVKKVVADRSRSPSSSSSSNRLGGNPSAGDISAAPPKSSSPSSPTTGPSSSSSPSVIRKISFAKNLLAIGSINDLSIGFILAVPVALVGGMAIFARISLAVLVFGLASLFFRTHVAPAAFSMVATQTNLGRSGTKAILFLGTMAWCILFALSTDILGLSIECGAFASGIYLAGTHNVRDIAEMIDAVTILFGSLYFASVGMILNVQ
eukprot:g4828.t1